jgi:hypothetical protein
LWVPHPLSFKGAGFDSDFVLGVVFDFAFTPKNLERQ